jgi:hypothetical protein
MGWGFFRVSRNGLSCSGAHPLGCHGRQDHRMWGLGSSAVHAAALSDVTMVFGGVRSQPGSLACRWCSRTGVGCMAGARPS